MSAPRRNFLDGENNAVRTCSANHLVSIERDIPDNKLIILEILLVKHTGKSFDELSLKSLCKLNFSTTPNEDDLKTSRELGLVLEKQNEWNSINEMRLLDIVLV